MAGALLSMAGLTFHGWLDALPELLPGPGTGLAQLLPELILLLSLVERSGGMPGHRASAQGAPPWCQGPPACPSYLL